jgi:phosphate:Na+ symporter
MPPDIDWLQLAMTLLGGLALFLAGLEVLSEGLRMAAGDTLRSALQRMTGNPFLGVLTGAFVTGILNSSSVTTVLVVGFVTAGLMSLSQSVGVIMGANIGSTVTAQILAFNVSAYALLPVAVGFFCFFVGRRERIRHVGLMILGLGLVFYGMGLMSDGMAPLRTFAPFIELLAEMERPLYGIVAGALFTGLVQSSAATVGIAIAMASEGLLTLEAGIALALGANVGTCVTALLAALGKPAEAVRAAVVHICFNIIGVIVWLPFIPLLGDLAVTVTPASDRLDDAARIMAEVPRQIANANTLFNVANTLLFVGFSVWFARLAEWLVPERPAATRTLIQPEFLNEATLKAPALALESVRHELARAGSIVLSMQDDVGLALQYRDVDRLDSVARSRRQVDVLISEILVFLGEVRQEMLTGVESSVVQALATSANHLDHLAEMVESDLAATARAFIAGAYPASSEETRDLLRDLWEAARHATALAIQAIEGDDMLAATEVLALMDRVQSRSDALFDSHARRLRPDDPAYLAKVRMLLALIERLHEVYSLAARMARALAQSSQRTINPDSR